MTVLESGPLHFPAPAPSAEVARAVQQQLRGHGSSDKWLPPNLWPDLDEIRGEHLRVRSQCADALSELTELDRRFHDEDKQHERKLRQAQRDGGGSVKDARTKPEKRQAQRKAAEERMWAAAAVLSEVAAAVVALVREREDDWLADLRARLEPAREKRRELESQLAEQRALEWQLHMLGMWLQKLSEDGPLGRQPYPTPVPPPEMFSEQLLRASLEVSWHRDRPWKEGEGDDAVVSWQEQSQPIDDEDPIPVTGENDEPLEGDPTGQVSELDERPSPGAAV